MNKIIFIFCMTAVIFSHLWAFTYVYEKKVIPVNKPKYQKVSLQMARVVEPKQIEKKVEKIEKVIEKPIIKKEIFKKPIKKEAKRKLVKKIKKKKIKPKKKIVKKKIVKKIKEVKKVETIVEKKIIEPIKKVEIKEKIKPIKNVSTKNVTQSLEKVRKYKNDYKTALRASIDKNKKYPKSSRRLKEQGKVIVGFRVLKSGIFENMRIIKSSGRKRLDKAALKALLKTAKFRPFSKEITQNHMDLTLPIQFRLK